MKFLDILKGVITSPVYTEQQFEGLFQACLSYPGAVPYLVQSPLLTTEQVKVLFESDIKPYLRDDLLKRKLDPEFGFWVLHQNRALLANISEAVLDNTDFPSHMLWDVFQKLPNYMHTVFVDTQLYKMEPQDLLKFFEVSSNAVQFLNRLALFTPQECSAQDIAYRLVKQANAVVRGGSKLTAAQPVSMLFATSPFVLRPDVSNRVLADYENTSVFLLLHLLANGVFDASKHFEPAFEKIVTNLPDMLYQAEDDVLRLLALLPYGVALGPEQLSILESYFVSNHAFLEHGTVTTFWENLQFRREQFPFSVSSLKDMSSKEAVALADFWSPPPTAAWSLSKRRFPEVLWSMLSSEFEGSYTFSVSELESMQFLPRLVANLSLVPEFFAQKFKLEPNLLKPVNTAATPFAWQEILSRSIHPERKLERSKFLSLEELYELNPKLNENIANAVKEFGRDPMVWKTFIVLLQHYPHEDTSHISKYAAAALKV